MFVKISFNTFLFLMFHYVHLIRIGSLKTPRQGLLKQPQHAHGRDAQLAGHRRRAGGLRRLLSRLGRGGRTVLPGVLGLDSGNADHGGADQDVLDRHFFRKA